MADLKTEKTEKTEKTQDPISRIFCDVMNCEYHGKEKECTASHINVCTCDPVQQCCVSCATFIPKTGR